MPLDYLCLLLVLLPWCPASASHAGSAFHNQFAVHIDKGPEAADLVASQLGLINLGQIGGLQHHYLFEHPRLSKRSVSAASGVYSQLAQHADVLWCQQQRDLVRKKRDFASSAMEASALPDPLFKDQWYLNRGAVDGSDMNVIAAWSKGYTGKGVTVTILDDGIQTNHPDLAQNYDPLASYDINDNDLDPMPRDNGENKHGTRCAGEVAAVAFNQYCGVGVAYNASIGGIRMLDGSVNDAIEARALSLNPDHIDIYSASWGPEDDGKTVDGPGPLAVKAFSNGIINGRKGLGSIYVWASGNGGRKIDNCNCDGYTNSIFTLSISSATQGGRKPWYLEECSSTLATTYSSGTPSQDASITTVDQDARLRPEMLCTSSHTGTSASAPIAAGICALALQANPKLSWRDMQYIVILGANPEPLLHESGWATNAVGRKFSHKFGYGLMDAAAMVDLARSWPGVPQQRKCVSSVVEPHLAVPKDPPGQMAQVSVVSDGCAGTIGFLEHVQAIVSVRHSPRGSLHIVLESPQGSRSSLLMPRPKDRRDQGFDQWPFLTVHFWGERPAGTWTLQVFHVDLPGVSSNPSQEGELISFQLVFYGITDPIDWPPVFGPADRADLAVPQYTSADQPEALPEDVAASRDVDEQRVGAQPECQDDRVMCERRCPDGTYATADLKWCVQCHPDCELCFGPGSDHCLSCRAHPPALKLVSVQLGGGQCVQDCGNGSYVGRNGTACLACPPHCDVCLDGDSCQKCRAGFVMSVQQQQCVAMCPDGQFVDEQALICRTCHPSCATCIGPRSTQCAKCAAGSFYFERSCVRQCPRHYFADAMSQECSPCPEHCASCSSEKECLSCDEDWQVSMVSAGQKPRLICLPPTAVSSRLTATGLWSNDTCPDRHWFMSGATHRCEPCHPSCELCFRKDDTSCLWCASDHLLHITSCVDHESCPPGTFLSHGIECRHCPHACSQCSTPSVCLKCHPKYYLSVAGQCVASCPPGQSPDSSGRQCHLCKSPCNTCSPSRPEECTSCPDNKVLWGSQCLSQCPDAYFRHRHYCQPCFTSACQSCSGPLVGDCLNCTAGWALDSLTSMCRPCRPGWFYQSQLGSCQPCHSTCSSCQGPQLHHCTTCKKPLLFDALTRTCLNCCPKASQTEPCCDCSASREKCIRLIKTGTSTKRSNWSSEYYLLTNRSSTTQNVVLIGSVFLVLIILAIATYRWHRRHPGRGMRRRSGPRRRRVPTSPPAAYEKLPLTDHLIEEISAAEASSSSDHDSDDVSFRPEERRRFVALDL